MGNKLKVGDTIKCATSEEMVDLMMALAKEGIDTNFHYEKDGEHGLWLEIVEVRKIDEKKCDVCGTPLNLNKAKTYLVKNINPITRSEVYYDAIDCEECGCQNVLKERKTRVDGRKES